MSYYTESLKPRSEKVTLVTVEAVERLKLFSPNGSDWERLVSDFVVGVKDGSTIISTWSFEPKTKILTIIGGSNPKTRDISVTYRLFFSNAPFNLPYDLDSGEVVEFEPYINKIGSLGQQLDDQNTGIVLESSSSVEFFNSDGRFDNTFDRYIFENQQIKFYSWFPTIPINEAVLLFDGVIESKSFSISSVSFTVKDFVFKLKDKVDLGLYSDTDGIILPSLVGTAKRRIYGQADNVKTVSLDATLDGFTIAGTISIAAESSTAIGVGTLFLKELSIGDELFFTFAGQDVKIAVELINSDTSLSIGKILDFPVNGIEAKVKPKINYRYKNRTWHISHHKLRSPSSTITNVLSNNRFEVDNVLDIFSGDKVIINGIQSTVRRISGDTIVSESAISPIPSIGNIIQKLPVSAVYFGSKELVYSRDYLILNSTEAKIVINELAEFNITEQVGSSTILTFTAGSRSVSTPANLDIRTILNPRDWIRSSALNEPNWYEVLQVSEQLIVLRSPFAGATGSKTFIYKNVEYISEESLITVSCMGREVDGLWIKTASDAVKDLVVNDSGFASVNNESFLKAKADCNYILSMVIPEKLGEGYPIIREVISKINGSVFGALYGNASNDISYSIFNSKKPEIINPLRDDDIISFSVQTNQNIVNESKISYAPYVDIYSGEDSFKIISSSSSVVNKLVGIKALAEKTVYLYEEDKAKIIAQRICFFNSLSSSIVNLKTKMNLSQVNVNDKVYLDLDRLFTRYSGDSRRKLGVVSGIKKNSFNCEVTITDLGNIYNRVMSIAPNSALDYSSSSVDDKVRWGYFLDNDTETPDSASESGLGSNIIG
jgi:hypothetical protein